MKKSQKLTAFLLSAVLCAGVMAGCSGTGSGEVNTEQPPAESAPANREGEVNQQAYETERDSSGTRTMTFGIQNYGGGGIDPAREINCAWNVSRYGVGECLFMFDNAMNVQNKLCDSYTVNDEHTEWVFHIRDGVKFSDGCDLTAEAVKASFARLFEAGPSGSSAPQKYLEAEAEITADNASGNVTIKTSRPYVDLTKNLSYPVMVILDVEHTVDYDHAAIGTGPYVATNFREEVGYTMVANENYWDGEVPFASIELLYMGDASAKAMALQSGQLDLAENVTNISDLRNLQADPNFTVTIANGVRTGLAHLNMAEGRLLSNKTLREVLPGEDVDKARHPYTQALLGAIFDTKMDFSKKIESIDSEIPSPLDVPPGCPFQTRCEHCTEVCHRERPALKAIGAGHEVACHLF